MVSPEFNTLEVFDWLSGITDPEIPEVTINELGMLREVNFKEDSYIVTLTPTYAGCPAMLRIENKIREKFDQHGLRNFKINTEYTPTWSTDWISEEVKKKMKSHGIAPPPHSSCIKALKDFTRIACPYCDSGNTEIISRFGSTPCKALYKCNSCKEPFQHFKCH